MKPEELREYGEALAHHAKAYATQHSIDLDAIHDPEDPDSVQFHLDVILAASRWCQFWSLNGHPLESYW
jgi:hypothetical protein